MAYKKPFSLFARILAACGLSACSDSMEPSSVPWREMLSRPKITEQEFTLAYAQAIEERAPTLKATVAGQLKITVTGDDDTDFTCFLGNAWADTRDLPEARIERFETQLNSVMETFVLESDSEISESNIIPVIKDRIYLQQVIELTGQQENLPLHEPLVADYLVFYAADTEYSTAYPPESELRAAGIDTHNLRERAIENLRDRLPDIELHGAGPAYMITAGGDYEASLLLLDDVWDQLADEVEGELVAVAIARDFLLFTGSESPDGLQFLRDKAKELHESESSYLISQTLLVRKNGSWEAFE